MKSFREFMIEARDAVKDATYTGDAAEQERIRQRDLKRGFDPDKERAAFLESIAANGIEIDVYGNNWHKFISHKNITSYQPVYGNEFWKILRKSKGMQHF